MLILRTLFYIFLVLSLLLYKIDNLSAECKKIRIETRDKGDKVVCVEIEDSSKNIQEGINYAKEGGGGIIYLDAGSYRLKKPIFIKSGVSLLGKPNLTNIIVESEIAITQKNEDIVDSIFIKDLIFMNGKKDENKYVFYIVGALQNSRFENLRFFGFDNQTLFYIAPNYKAKPARNVVFNKFKDIFADSCGKCIIYSGNPYSIVSENTWENIMLKQVNQKAIEAVNWVDTEKWYNLYAMAMNSNVILIDINANNLEHAHGFHFYSPSLVYSWHIAKSPQKPIAIRLGKGTIRNIFIGVATDKRWDKFFIDDNAESYFILMDTVEDRNKIKPNKNFIKIIKKGILGE